MKKVIIESPYRGNIKENTEYARECLLDSLMRGEAPIASHLLYTQVLDEDVPEQRRLGIDAGLAWYNDADLIAFYVDYGMSEGMKEAKKLAEKKGKKVEIRMLNFG